MPLRPLPQPNGIHYSLRALLSWSGTAKLLITGVATCATSAAIGQISLSKETPKTSVNSEASRILQQMAETYAHLSSLQQRSEYTSTTVKLDDPTPKPVAGQAGDKPAGQIVPQKSGAVSAGKKPEAAEGDVDDNSPNRRIDRTVELLFAQPNLLKITQSRSHETDPAAISTWVSNGKTYCAFVPGSHNSNSLLYTQEKAPRSIRDFSRLQNLDGGCLELVMLMGVNPFQNLTPDLATLRVEEPARVRGVETNVITIVSLTRMERNELHLYIGREDHMLHRFISDVTPTNVSAAAPRIGDALDEMEDETKSADPPVPVSDKDHPLESDDLASGQRQGPVRIHMVYDNVITPVTHVEPEAFTFQAPPRAALFVPTGSKPVIDPNAKRLADIIRKSRQAHAKPVRDVAPVHDVSP